FLEIDDGLGDLGGVVGDALEVPCRVDEPQPRVDTLGMSDDLPLEQLEHVPIMAVDTFFGGNHGLCLNGIRLNQGVKAVVHLVQSFHSQIFQWLRDWEGQRIDGQLPDPFGDVASQVSQALEITVDLEDSSHAAEVGGDRLVQGQHANALTFNA